MNKDFLVIYLDIQKRNMLFFFVLAETKEEAIEIFKQEKGKDLEAQGIYLKI